MTATRLLTTTLAAAFLMTPAFAFDRATINAIKACHDYVWFEVPVFKDLPNAAISAFPGSLDGKTGAPQGLCAKNVV